MASRQEPARTARLSPTLRRNVHSRTARLCLAVVKVAMLAHHHDRGVRSSSSACRSGCPGEDAISHAAQRSPECRQGLPETLQKFVSAFGEDDDLVFGDQRHGPCPHKAAADELAGKLPGPPDQFDASSTASISRRLHSRSLQ